MADRVHGEEALVFYRGKWVHCKWDARASLSGRWHLGRNLPFIADRPEVVPIPPKPDNCDGFYDWDN